MPAKISYTSAVVLEAISSGFRYGFDIMDSTGLPSGTVYPALRRLERAGAVRSRWERKSAARQANRPARKYYELTAVGARTLAEARARYRGIERLFAATGAQETEA